MNWHTTLATAPAAEPMTVEQAKDHLVVGLTEDDTYIGSLVTAARQYAEDFLGRKLVNQTWDMFSENDLSGEIIVPFPPLSSVTTIKYYDTTGSQQTLADTVYQVDTNSCPGRIKELRGQSWPSCYGSDKYGNVEIRFVCGYGAASTNVPDDIIHAIKILVGHWYEHREMVITGTIVTPIPRTVDDLLWMHRVPEIG